MSAEPLNDWLEEQGARVVSKRPLRRVSFKPLDMADIHRADIEYIQNKIEEDHVFTVEIPGPLLRELKGKAARLDHILEWGRKHNSSVSEYFHEQINRHYALLEENSMYKDAYREFMSIRALLGEEPSLF
jgi:hypothetical protein